MISWRAGEQAAAPGLERPGSLRGAEERALRRSRGRSLIAFNSASCLSIRLCAIEAFAVSKSLTWLFALAICELIVASSFS